jgi:hypothetical protein
MDLSNGGTLEMVHAFEDFAGRGQAWVATYSGGFGPSYLEEILIYMDLDGDDGALYGGAPFSAALDTSGYANPSDVYIGFWYTTDGGTYAWSYSIDDIYVYTFITGVPAFLWCTYDPALEFADDFENGLDTFWLGGSHTKSGDYWTYDEGADLWIYDQYHDCGTQVWPTYGPGMDNALYTVIELGDECEDWSFAEFIVDHTLYMDLYDHAYIEVSTDFDPDSTVPMCQQDATWTVMWERGVPCTQDRYFGYAYTKVIDLTQYIDAGFDKVTVRFRYTTLGNDFNAHPNGGWWIIEAPMVQCKTETFTDTTPPVTTLVFDETSATVNLYANDPGMRASGVAATYYRIDGGSQQQGTTFTVQNGQHSIEYWSVDNAGNEESHKTASVTVDTEPPTISITEPTAGIYLLGNKILSMGSQPICIGKVTIKADASDDGTGVQMVTFDVDGDTGYASSAPYEYTYRGVKFGSAKATATAYDGKGLTAQDSVDFTIFSLGLL